MNARAIGTAAGRRGAIAPAPGLTAGQRADFDHDGYVIIPGALSSGEVRRAQAGVQRIHEQERHAGRLGRFDALHHLSAVSSCPELAFLLDHPDTLPLVWSILGWNLHIYHSHLDVHPPQEPGGASHWGWHQDGGRQNRELETNPRPRTSVKVAYWLSDVSEPGRGNLMVVPGSHIRNWLPGPARRDLPCEPPRDAIEICARPGDAVLFDRRLWHQRSANYSEFTRMAVFLGYTYRWIVGRDEVTDTHRAQPWWSALNCVQQQLLGGTGSESGDHRWGHYPSDTALYRHIRDLGGLDPTNPPLIPDGADAR